LSPPTLTNVPVSTILADSQPDRAPRRVTFTHRSASASRVAGGDPFDEGGEVDLVAAEPRVAGVGDVADQRVDPGGAEEVGALAHEALPVVDANLCDSHNASNTLQASARVHMLAIDILTDRLRAIGSA
jgi:hypothetical protein